MNLQEKMSAVPWLNAPDWSLRGILITMQGTQKKVVTEAYGKIQHVKYITITTLFTKVCRSVKPLQLLVKLK